MTSQASIARRQKGRSSMSLPYDAPHKKRSPRCELGPEEERLTYLGELSEPLHRKWPTMSAGSSRAPAVLALPPQAPVHCRPRRSGHVVSVTRDVRRRESHYRKLRCLDHAVRVARALEKSNTSTRSKRCHSSGGRRTSM